MNTYNWNAKDYERHSGSQQKWARELIQKLRLKGSEDILDIGCGDGKVTAEIANLVPDGSVLGIDNSKSMVELVNEKYVGPKYANLSFQEMDARHLSFEKCFDVVFSNASLHWVKYHRPVLEGIYNSLRSSGRILLQMGGEGNAGGILSVLNDLIASSVWQPYFNDFEFPYGFYGIEEYSKLLEGSGFNIKRVGLIPKDMIHNNQSDLEGWIRTTWLPYTERVPSVKRDSLIQKIATNYVEKHPTDSAGRIHVAMVRLEVEADRI